MDEIVMLIFLYLIITLFFSNHYIFAVNTKYYVNDSVTNNDVWCSTNGNDLHDGLSPGKPKLTITNLIKTYTLGSNDVLYVDTGVYTECVRISSADTGRSNGFILFQGAGISNAVSIIDGTGGITTSDGCFTLDNTDWVKITGFKCIPSGTDPYYGVLLKGGCEHIIISNNFIVSNKWTGICLEDNIKYSSLLTNTIKYNNQTGNGWGIVIKQSEYNDIKKNIVQYNGETGISIEDASQYNTIRGNYVMYHTTSAGTGIAVQPGGGSQVHHNDFINNIIYGNNRNMDINNSYNNVIRSNNIGSAVNVGLFAHNSSHDNIIEQNYFRQGGSWGLLLVSERSYHEIIRKNRCYKSQIGGGIRIEGRVAGPCYNLLIYSNTCASNIEGGIVADVWDSTWINLTTSTLINNECIYNDNAPGIYLYNANNNVIKGNKCYNNSANNMAGIYMEKCMNNTVWSNNCYQNWYGINMEKGKQNVIKNNILNANNSYGIYNILCTNSQIIKNTIISNFGYGLYESSSGNELIYDNIVHNNSNGIYFSSSSGMVFRNILYNNNRNGYGTGLYLNSSIVNIKNNTIYGHKDYGIYTTTIQAVSNNITLSNGLGIYSTTAGQNVYYSCITDDVNANVVLDSTCISNDPLFHNTSIGNEDFYLRYNSPCIGSGSSNIVPSCMGAHTGYNIPEHYTLGIHPHTITWTTMFSNGSVPSGGTVVIDFPVGAFDLSTITSVTTSSWWGGTSGAFNYSVSGQRLTVTRDGAGTASIPGDTENLIVYSISNITAGTDFQLSIETRTVSDKIIENLTSNDFAVRSPVIYLNKGCSVSRAGTPSPAIPGSTLTYSIFCSNSSIGTILKTIVLDYIPPNTSYVSNSDSSISGWTVQWATNAIPDTSYNSSDFIDTEPSPSKVRWVRWIRPFLGYSNGSQQFEFKVVVE